MGARHFARTNARDTAQPHKRLLFKGCNSDRNSARHKRTCSSAGGFQRVEGILDPASFLTRLDGKNPSRWLSWGIFAWIRVCRKWLLPCHRSQGRPCYAMATDRQSQFVISQSKPRELVRMERDQGTIRSATNTIIGGVVCLWVERTLACGVGVPAAGKLG